jgi:serine phosphatase RsbU (regulator of sigma subunit)
MNKYRLILTIICSFIMIPSLLSQEKEISQDQKSMDELKMLYLENKQTRPFLAMEYAAQALQIAESLNDSSEIATFYNYLGDSYFSKKSYSMAMDNYFKSYLIFQRLNDQKNVAYSYLDIGAVYFEQNLSSIAYGYFIKARDIFESTNDKEGLSHAYDKIGFVLLRQGDETNALEHFINSHYFRKSLKDTLLTAISNKNIAEVYFQREEFDKAISFLNDASINFKAIKDYLNIAETDFKIGEIYTYNKDFRKAKEYYQSALTNFQKFGKLYEISKTYNRLSKVHLDEGNIAVFKDFATRALEIANENEFLDIKAESYSLLSKYYELTNQIEMAFKFERMRSGVVDSIIEARYISQSAEMQVSFEIQRQENAIQILTKEQEMSQTKIRNQRIISISIALATLLILFSAIVLYRSNQNRKKVNQLLVAQKKDIEDKNFELERQKDSIEEKNIRIQRINKNITGSINYASRIQQAMLPKTGYYRQFVKDIFVYFRPKEIVSGDFYWFARNAEQNKVFLAAVDCTGHGVPGAFMSLIGISFLNQIVNAQKLTEPDLILNRLHEYIRASLNQARNQSRDGMDIALCAVDYNNKVVEYAGARNPLIYIVNNEVFQLKADGMDIGGIQKESERRFTKQTFPLEDDMTLYLFTDGYQDQFGGRDKQKFMRKNFKDLLFNIHQSDMIIQYQRLDETIENWISQEDGSKLEQVDDILVVGVKIS